MAIEPDQSYHRLPAGPSNPLIRLRIMAVGPNRAEVFHLNRGRRGEVLRTALHECPTTKAGQPRRTGYALETE
ncbi:hypothetical protein [Kitasatospora sp. NPDC050543]|uniref:hypothetical protein n=1 Tax=Kitasatospora sp. NPDC050543 TaxID=3364054 RepID=UPI0037BC01A9